MAFAYLKQMVQFANAPQVGKANIVKQTLTSVKGITKLATKKVSVKTRQGVSLASVIKLILAGLARKL